MPGPEGMPTIQRRLYAVRRHGGILAARGDSGADQRGPEHAAEIEQHGFVLW